MVPRQRKWLANNYATHYYEPWKAQPLMVGKNPLRRRQQACSIERDRPEHSGKAWQGNHSTSGAAEYPTSWRSERNKEKISSTRMRSRSMLGESAIAAKGRDDKKASSRHCCNCMTSSREVFIIIVTLLQLYDETTKNLQHQRTMHHSNKSTLGTTRLIKNGQEMDIDKRWLHVIPPSSTKEKNSSSCDRLPRQIEYLAHIISKKNTQKLRKVPSGQYQYLVLYYIHEKTQEVEAKAKQA